VTRRLSRRRRAHRPTADYVPWMAIAAAGSTPEPAPRGARRGPWLLVGAVVVVLVLVGLIVARSGVVAVGP
jgi:hypothetical protein